MGEQKASKQCNILSLINKNTKNNISITITSLSVVQTRNITYQPLHSLALD